MKEKEEMINESLTPVVPDIEISVRAGEQEIAAIALFQNKSNVWDVLIGVDDRERRDQLATLFTTCISALAIADFTPLHEAGGAQLSFLDGTRGQSHYEADKNPKR